MVAENHGESPSQAYSFGPVPGYPDLMLEGAGIIGRDEDLAAISSLILADGVRLLTLIGPAGVGKTRLALEVGRSLVPHFPHGVVFVDLAPTRDPGLVLPTIGRRLGVPDSGPPIAERLRAHLSGREMLLILDNLEQALPADLGLEDLLVAAPQLVLLATSREPLHLLWEQLYHVPPLALPDPDHLPSLEELAAIPSVALFLRRARMVDPDFRLTDENARSVAELVVHLDGLPLAIKLAAVRTQLLSPQMLLQRLGQRLSLLRWEAQDLPVRQQTLSAAIAWSYEQLSQPEQVLFRSLGMFDGRFSLDAAEAIVPHDPTETLDLLGSLVNKSLVQREDDGRGSYLFRLLESVREFALERLAEAGELEAAQGSHAHYYLELAERAEPELTGLQQRVWFLHLEETQGNLRAALEWLIDHDPDRALRLSVALAHFWEIRGYTAEGCRWLETTLVRAPSAASTLRARALVWLGVLLALSVDRTAASGVPDVTSAEAVLTEGMELARTMEDAESVARALTFLGLLSVQTGEWERGRRVLREALACWQTVGHDWGTIQVLVALGVIAFLQHDHEETRRVLEETLRLSPGVGDDWARGVALFFLVHETATQGDRPRAVSLGNELLALTRESQSSRLLCLSTAAVAWLVRDDGDPEILARLAGAAESVSQATGLVASVVQRVYVTPAKEVLQSRMEQGALDAALDEGRRLTFSQVAELMGKALNDVLQHVADGESHPAGDRGILSTREQEVLQLVAEGFSNKQIARELFIAESTVRYHLTSIFNKLGVDSRTHALAVAAQRGLINLGTAD